VTKRRRPTFVIRKTPPRLAGADVDRDEPVTAFRHHCDGGHVLAACHQAHWRSADARADVGRAVGLAIFDVAELDLAIGREPNQDRARHQGRRRRAWARPKHLAVVPGDRDDVRLGSDHQSIAAHEDRVRVEPFEANTPAFIEL
jgi:hypothetical protein